jgi:hypothetical protein
MRFARVFLGVAECGWARAVVHLWCSCGEESATRQNEPAQQRRSNVLISLRSGVLSYSELCAWTGS